MFFVLFFLHQERELYNEIKEASLKKCLDENIILGPATRTAASKTSEQAISFSFDFAQQLAYPHDPMQPGPMYTSWLRENVDFSEYTPKE